MSSVTAILIAYNSGAVIADALRALAAETAVARIIVVDNCSTDETCELLRREFPQVELIENPRNLGFGRGNNVALELVQTPYALLVNPDAVLQPGALAALLSAAMRYRDAAILAPQLLDAEGRVYTSYKRSVFLREKSGGRDIAPEGDICAEYLSGAVWLVDMQHMRQVGFFDPAIFLYYEDDDVCLRARQRGYGLVLVHDARALHLMGASSGTPSKAGEFFRQKHMIWSRLYIEEKYHGTKSANRLAARLRMEYTIKAAMYALCFNKQKLARYRGRLAGVLAFSEHPAAAPK